MKTRQLFLTFFILLFIAPVFAQATIGIPVQGIARDADGTARIGQSVINLSFEFYTLNGTQETPLGSPQSQTLSTDSFGVFSTIVDTNGLRPAFANSPVHLRIQEGTTVISDEILNSVPYAIAADNGVPTGAIMPFVGTNSQVPVGWLLCDGAAIPSGIQYNALITLQGNNTPNLQGMFLRGVGTNNLTSETTVLNGVQDDRYLNHGHGDNFSIRANQGGHGHTLRFSDGGQGAGRLPLPADGVGTLSSVGSAEVQGSGTHNHTVDGNVFTSTTGGNETRPVNYGVNYIIKL